VADAALRAGARSDPRHPPVHCKVSRHRRAEVANPLDLRAKGESRPEAALRTLPGDSVAATLTLSSTLGYVLTAGFTTLDCQQYGNTNMATLNTTIPDDLSRQVHSMARARGIPVHRLVEEALRCVVSPEPFATDADALAELESMESDVLKDLPWEK